MLYDTSDMERVGGEAATAAMAEGTRRCCACHLRDLLPCLGGVAALLPLFAQLGAPSSMPSLPSFPSMRTGRCCHDRPAG